MIRLLWILFWAVIIVTGLTILAGYFMNDSISGVCSDKLIGCLETSINGTWWQKISNAAGCVATNVVCVFKQIGASF